jgi:hypothetical protein
MIDKTAKISLYDIARFFLLLLITSGSYLFLFFVITGEGPVKYKDVMMPVIVAIVTFFSNKKARQLKYTIILGLLMGGWFFIWHYYWDKL